MIEDVSRVSDWAGMLLGDAYIEDLTSLRFRLPSGFSVLDLDLLEDREEMALEGGYFGLKRHNRCFYKRLEGRALPGGADLWLAFKGVSILYPVQQKPIEYRSADTVLFASSTQEEIFHFAEREHEFPYGMTLAACLEDYNAPLAFLDSYAGRLSALPDVPIPVAVLKVRSDLEILSRNREFLLANAPESSGSILAQLLFPQPLGVYVYAMRSSPVRIGHVNEVPKEVGERAYSRCLAIVVEMINSGLIPCRRENLLDHRNVFSASFDKGMCVSAWNVTVDGGIRDFNSVKKLSDYRSEAELRFDLQLTVQALARLFLGISPDLCYLFPESRRSLKYSNEVLYVESCIYLQQVVYRYLSNTVRSPDPRINRYFSGGEDSIFDQALLLAPDSG